jgi:hypothetical protein
MTPALQWVHMINTADPVRTLYVNRADDQSSVATGDAAFQTSDNSRRITGHGPGDDGIVCRKLGARDLRHLVSNYRLVHVDQPDSLIERTGPLGIAVRGLRPFARLNPITNLAFTANDRFLAFSQFRQFGPDRRWVLSGVGLANGLFAPERVVQDLLEFSVMRAGRKGVKRLFARVQSESPIREALDQVGFEAYMREDLFVLDGAPALALVDGSTREQEQGDTWAIHQLYHAAVPKQVQSAEAWTSHQWDVTSPKRKNNWWRSFVLEADHQIIAYARVCTGANAAAIEFMYLPDQRNDLEGFCGGVLDQAIRAGGASRVFVPVRAHQSELMTILERIGFSSVRGQDLLIKYTAAKVTAVANETVILAPVDVRERVPKRVPTFLSPRVREKISI